MRLCSVQSRGEAHLQNLVGEGEGVVSLKWEGRFKGFGIGWGSILEGTRLV